MGRQGMMDDAGWHGCDLEQMPEDEATIEELQQIEAFRQRIINETYEECAEIFSTWVDCDKCPMKDECDTKVKSCKTMLLEYLKG